MRRALKESEYIENVVQTIGWPTQNSFGSYEARSISAARAAKESVDARDALLASAAKRLTAKDARSLAIDLCRQMMLADGTQTDREAAVIRDIEAALC